ncbi:MAG: serine hydroxymethyltransferase [bacterium]|nr:serine hydroxymethyltransferase [bacterium]
MDALQQRDPEVAAHVTAELQRQREQLVMIPSENYVSPAVLAATGSVLTNKYSEGYPGKRYYTGNEHVDAIEQLARVRAQKLFGYSHANVQPYSGSPANHAICFALLNPGETLMGMHLLYGGHLTHGWGVNFSGTYYHAVQYTTNADGWLDYDAIAELARAERPKLIFCGGTAYPRTIDFARLGEIARSVDAFLVADVSHIAGLIAAGVHPSPAGHADVMMTTTHKTLRGPRGAVILCSGEPSNPLKSAPRTRENLPTLIDRAVFPGLQGGPHDHQTAAIAVALGEASTPAFTTYGRQIVANARALAETLLAEGCTLITGGTDNHLLLLDVTPHGTTGRLAAEALSRAGISVNANSIPHDPRKPFDPSGIRIGTPALTTRGFNENDMRTVGNAIAAVLKTPTDNVTIERTRQTVRELCAAHPLYAELAGV